MDENDELCDAIRPITYDEWRKRSFERSRKEQPWLTQKQRQLALYGLGLSGEAGEVSDEIKKYLFHDKPLDREHLLAECGDVLWYLDRVLSTLDATLQEAWTVNDAKLAARFPQGWDEATQHYGYDSQ